MVADRVEQPEATHRVPAVVKLATTAPTGSGSSRSEFDGHLVVVDLGHLEAGAPEDLAQQARRVGVVVDDQDPRRGRRIARSGRQSWTVSARGALTGSAFSRASSTWMAMSATFT